jgi:anti-sigma28 factor (negative regulator of flagellin synthesis)
MQPVGMVGEQSFPELLGRVGKKVTKNQTGALRSQDPQRQSKTGYAASNDTESAIRYSARVARSQVAGSGVIARQLVLAVQEATAVGSYDIADDIARVKGLGIPVNIVKAHSDEMFDTQKVDTGYAGIADSVESYSSVADRTARHDTFWLQPERTAAIIGQLIQKS